MTQKNYNRPEQGKRKRAGGACLFENNGERASGSWPMHLCVHLHSTHCPPKYLFLPPWCCTWGFLEGHYISCFPSKSIFFFSILSMFIHFLLNFMLDQWWVMLVLCFLYPFFFTLLVFDPCLILLIHFHLMRGWVIWILCDFDE